MCAQGPLNIGDRHPKTGKAGPPTNGAAWPAPSRKSGRQHPAGSRHELQPFPRNPRERASHRFNSANGINGARGFKTKFKLSELRRRHPAGCPIMPKFLDDYFAGNWSRPLQALSASKGRILNRPGCHESHKIARPSSRNHGNLVVNAISRGLNCHRAAPAREYDRLGLPMMRPGGRAAARRGLSDTFDDPFRQGPGRQLAFSHKRRAQGPRDAIKSVHECIFSPRDLETLVCARGAKLSLKSLSKRLESPRRGSRGLITTSEDPRSRRIWRSQRRQCDFAG